MSSIAAASLSLAPSHLPPLSSAKAVKSSGLGSSSANTGSSASASGDTTSYVANADGSVSITTTNAQGQIVSIATLQTTSTAIHGLAASGSGAGGSFAPGTLLDRLV